MSDWQPSQDVFFHIPEAPYAYVRIAEWMEPLGWTLTDIVVPPKHQGQGHGRRLMKLALDWADHNGITLCITVAPTGPLDYDALDAWYRRLGFQPDRHDILRRKPHAPRSYRHDQASERVAP